jgi:hypothetical protein
MSKGKAKRRPRAAGRAISAQRPAATPDTQPRGAGGLFGRMFGPPVPASMSAMPPLRASLSRGFLLVGSSPFLLLAPFVLVLAAWLLLLAIGFVGSPVGLVQMLALPPISTAFDVQNAITVLGQRSGLIASLALLPVRGLIISITAGLVLEGFERRGRVSAVGIVQGLRAFPLVLASLMLSFVGLFVGQFALFLGPGLGTLVQLFVPVLLIFVLGFIPFAAVRNRWNLAETMRRSLAAARAPGGRHLTFCTLYVMQAFLLPILAPERGLITANPSVLTWVSILVLTFVHVGFTAAFAYRWLGVEKTVLHAPTTRR